MNDGTKILSQIQSGDPAAAELLLPLVYDELRKLAAHKLEKGWPRPIAYGVAAGESSHAESAMIAMAVPACVM